MKDTGSGQPRPWDDFVRPFIARATEMQQRGEGGAQDVVIQASQKYYFLLLILLGVALALLLHNLSTGSLPTFDDTTYALISKTILRTGDWVTMRWLDVPYFYAGKPPLGFWFTAVFYKLLGISELTSRLSAAVHGIAGLVAVYFIGSLYSHRVGL